jgi:photosynthetic reaction center cytochrome c subunit
MLKALVPLVVVVGFLFAFAIVSTMDRPPVVSEQIGFRGTGMEQTVNPRVRADLAEANQAPEGFGPTEPGGDLARDIYENVELLGHLTEDEFNALMISITEWVSPEAGCEYCHNIENMASEEVYAKGVARRMIQMTWTINEDYGDHVKEAGVNCYTCHRGNNIPEYAWYSETGPAEKTGGFSASRNNQNVATEVAVYSSLPYDALDRLLTQDAIIGVQSYNVLPIAGDPLGPLQNTEVTYSLMMHFSDSLGVNCTYCHNSRAFSSWEESPPAREQALLGISMVREANMEYVMPLQDMIPVENLGPKGDIAKVSCMTCHQGVNQPLLGASMLEDHPSLGGAPQ